MATSVEHLITSTNARTDAPTTLHGPGVSDIPLPCEDDDDVVEDLLMAHRAELRIAQRTGLYRDHAVERYPIPRTQYGFLAVALLRALEDCDYPERVKWLEDYKRIQSGVDAALFMTEAKLKARYGIDMKKLVRKGNELRSNRRSILQRLNLR
jgi:hypothetical protein